MEQTYTQLEEDEERFHKLQMTDQANFNDKLDTLSVCADILCCTFVLQSIRLKFRHCVWMSVTNSFQSVAFIKPHVQKFIDR